jgi:hypothetical protein
VGRRDLRVERRRHRERQRRRLHVRILIQAFGHIDFGTD